MENQEKTKIQISLSFGSDITVRDLEAQQIELFNYLNTELSQQAEIKLSSSRSVDPTVVGAIAIAVLPVAIEKLADLVAKWAELRKDCSITIYLPKGKDSISITYNPKTTSQETLQKWINDAANSSSTTRRR